MKLLLLHPGALGDIILALPALAGIRSRHPRCKITLAGNLDFLEPVAHGFVCEICSLSALPLHRLHSPGPSFKEDRNFWRRFDAVVSWTGFGDERFTRNLEQANPNSRVARWNPARGESEHVSRLFFESLEEWVSIPRRISPVRIPLRDADAHAGDSWLRSSGLPVGELLVALHPGAGSSKKRWPLIRFEQLAREILSNSSASLVILEGPAEEGLGTALADRLAQDRVRVVSSLPLGMVAGILGQCGFFVGNDSGIAHLAAGLGIRSLVLFGPTLPEMWSPLGGHVVALRVPRGCDGCETESDSAHTCLENISVSACAAQVLGKLR